MRKGFFITFEGLEGSGKSTQIKLLKDCLNELGVPVICTREPGGTYIGDEIRDLLLDPDNQDMDYKVEALLYAASRAQLVSKIISPALNDEKIIISDRYIDSSLAYQCYGRGLPFDLVSDFNKWATAGLEPDLTIYLKINPKVGLKRATTEFADRIELEDLSFHERVEQGYKELSQIYKDRFFIIDGTATPKEIHEAIIEKVDQVLSKRSTEGSVTLPCK